MERALVEFLEYHGLILGLTLQVRAFLNHVQLTEFTIAGHILLKTKAQKSVFSFSSGSEYF